MNRRAMLVLSGLLAAGLPAGGASAAPVTVNDVVGDANAINGQGFVAGAPGDNLATPGSHSSYDIASLTISSTFTGTGGRRVPKDLVVRLQLAGAPLRSGVAYFVETGRIRDCEMGIAFEFSADPTGQATSQLRTCATEAMDAYEVLLVSMPRFGERTVTWTVPYDRLAIVPHLRLGVGVPLPELGATARLSTGPLHGPVVDTLTSTASYRLGS